MQWGMQGGKTYETGILSFSNNYALNEAVGGMPEKDVTVELWARTPAYKKTAAGIQPSELLSYATRAAGAVPSSKLCLQPCPLHLCVTLMGVCMAREAARLCNVCC